jgi:hypothetical protein
MGHEGRSRHDGACCLVMPPVRGSICTSKNFDTTLSMWTGRLDMVAPWFSDMTQPLLVTSGGNLVQDCSWHGRGATKSKDYCALCGCRRQQWDLNAKESTQETPRVTHRYGAGCLAGTGN